MGLGSLEDCSAAEILTDADGGQELMETTDQQHLADLYQVINSYNLFNCPERWEQFWEAFNQDDETVYLQIVRCLFPVLHPLEEDALLRAYRALSLFGSGAGAIADDPELVTVKSLAYDLRGYCADISTNGPADMSRSRLMDLDNLRFGYEALHLIRSLLPPDVWDAISLEEAAITLHGLDWWEDAMEVRRGKLENYADLLEQRIRKLEIVAQALMLNIMVISTMGLGLLKGMVSQSGYDDVMLISFSTSLLAILFTVEWGLEPKLNKLKLQLEKVKTELAELPELPNESADNQAIDSAMAEVGCLVGEAVVGMHA